MKGKLSLIASAMAIGAGFTTTVSAGTDPANGAQAEMKQLISQRCVTCHELTTVSARHATVEEWHEIVQRMVMYGAQVNEPEVESIVAYLASTQGTTSASDFAASE